MILVVCFVGRGTHIDLFHLMPLPGSYVCLGLSFPPLLLSGFELFCSIKYKIPACHNEQLSVGEKDAETHAEYCFLRTFDSSLSFTQK